MVGERLTLMAEGNNKHDEYTVAVGKDGYVVGLASHLHLLSEVFWLMGNPVLIKTQPL